MTKPNSVVIYRGPSLLDGKPIIVIATGLRVSKNSKTGNMVQTYILREDLSPIEAIRSGADVSICGDCAYRGTLGKLRKCYVNLGQAPLNLWRTYHRGRFATTADIATLGEGRIVRLGSYGDPAAVPLELWNAFVSRSVAHTGYTHQWRSTPSLARLCMASCDSEANLAEASALGFRSFRVRGPNDPVLRGEVMCPASKEMGHKTTCSACRACGGNAGKARANIVIAAHGIGKRVQFTTNGKGA